MKEVKTMRIPTKLVKALNDQIKAELDSGYMYLAMANYFHLKNFTGIAHWFRVQAKEEQEHAMKIHDYLLERDEAPTLESVDAPETDWTGVTPVLEQAYQHECKVTEMIYNLVDIATETKDYASISFLQWYINEQVEEEAQSLELFEKSRMIGDSMAGLMVFDQQLGARKDD